MAFGQLLEHGIVQRLHGAGNEQAARSLQNGKQIAVLEQVLDFDGGVIGEPGPLVMKRLDEKLPAVTVNFATGTQAPSASGGPAPTAGSKPPGKQLPKKS